MIPAAPSVQRVRAALGERRFARAVARQVARDLTPMAPSRFARFGSDSVLVPPARVTSPECISVGRGVVILEHAFLSVRADLVDVPPRLVIGDGVRIGRGVHIACIGEVVFGDDAMTSDYVFVGDCYHGYTDPHTPVVDQPMSAPEPVRIGAGAYLGAGSIVLPGVTVGEGAYVGEGAVVTRDVAPHTVVLGNPAVALDPAATPPFCERLLPPGGSRRSQNGRGWDEGERR